MWPSGDLYIDDEEAFKTALGGPKYRNWWLLKPSVLRNLFSYASRFGTATDDVTDKKTTLLGGALVIRNGEVVYTHKETNTFDNGDARELLAAALGKPLEALDVDVSSTPEQYDAICTRDAADVCSK